MVNVIEFRDNRNKQIVVAFEFNSRDALQIMYLYEKQKKLENENNDAENSGSKSIICQNFKVLEPILKMIKSGLNIKIVYFFRNNFYINKNIIEEFEEYLKKSVKDAQCEIAYSYVDLWFQLFKNVENRDIIHIFSSEKLRPPEAALRMLKDKRSEDRLKIHYTGSSLQGYYSNVEKVLNNQIKHLSSREFAKFSNASLLSVPEQIEEVKIQIEEVKIPVEVTKNATNGTSTKENTIGNILAR